MDITGMLSPPYGLVSLFGLSFLASTLVPLGSEWLLILLIVQGHPALTTVAVATLGNSLGAVTTYLIGIFGSDVLTRRVLRLSDQDLHRARTMYRRFGDLVAAALLGSDRRRSLMSCRRGLADPPAAVPVARPARQDLPLFGTGLFHPARHALKHADFTPKMTTGKTALLLYFQPATTHHREHNEKSSLPDHHR